MAIRIPAVCAPKTTQYVSINYQVSHLLAASESQKAESKGFESRAMLPFYVKTCRIHGGRTCRSVDLKGILIIILTFK